MSAPTQTRRASGEVETNRATLVGLLDDLRAEQAELSLTVRDLGDPEWAQPTTPGWTVRDQIAHLAFFDGAAARAILTPAAFAVEKAHALADVVAYEEMHLRDLPSDGPGTAIAWDVASARFRHGAETADPGARVQWYGPDMSLLSMVSARLMETWAHGHDVAAALGRTRVVSDRLRHVAGLAVRARNQGYLVRGRPAPHETVRVELVGPAGQAWEFGDVTSSNSVRGPAEEFCLVLTRRRHVDDTALVTSGSAAREWMEIGQAYAGPPGAGPARIQKETSN